VRRAARRVTACCVAAILPACGAASWRPS
jgi:hypothetical protein